MNKYIPVVASSVILAVFIYFLCFRTLSVPTFDDYDTTLLFIRSSYFENTTGYDKFLALFQRHNEHRILASRALAAVYFNLFGKLNFSHLIIIQSIFLFGCISLILGLLKRSKVPFEYAVLLCAVFLLNFSFYQVSFFYWGGIQHFAVSFFSLASLVFLDRAKSLSDYRYALALITASLAGFSFGNGFVCLLIGLFLLWAQRKYILLIPWSVLSVALIYVQFFVKTSTTSPTHASLNFDWALRLLFTFSGSFLFVNPPGQFPRYANITICALAGIVVLAYWVYLFFSGFAKKNPLLYALLSFPLLTGFIIAVARFDTKSAGGIASRYMFFTALLPIALLLILWEKKVLTKKHLPAICIFSLMLWAASFYNNSKEYLQASQDVTQRIDLWKKDKSHQLIYFSNSPSYSELLQWAVQNHVVEVGTNNHDTEGAVR